MDDRRMVPSPEAVANDWKRRLRIPPAEVHRDLSRHSNRSRALLGSQIPRADMEEITHGLLDRLDRDRGILFPQDALQNLAGEVDADFAFVQRGEGAESGQ